MNIGFFDSGIGGLTVLREALRLLPNEDFIYYADTDHVPYGPKPRDEVKKYILDAAEFLVNQGVKALVIACNTATVVAIEELREKYDFPILGMEPAVKPAVEGNRNKNKRVLVTATALALKQEKFLKLVARLNAKNTVDMLALPGLVTYAESFNFDERVSMAYLSEMLAGYDLTQYGTVVLGCTHFPFYREAFRKLLPESVDIIDGSLGTVRHLKNVLKENGLLETAKKQGNIVFYSSGRLETDADRLAMYMSLLKNR